MATAEQFRELFEKKVNETYRATSESFLNSQVSEPHVVGWSRGYLAALRDMMTTTADTEKELYSD